MWLHVACGSFRCATKITDGNAKQNLLAFRKRNEKKPHTRIKKICWAERKKPNDIDIILVNLKVAVLVTVTDFMRCVRVVSHRLIRRWSLLCAFRLFLSENSLKSWYNAFICEWKQWIERTMKMHIENHLFSKLQVKAMLNGAETRVNQLNQAIRIDLVCLRRLHLRLLLLRLLQQSIRESRTFLLRNIQFFCVALFSSAHTMNRESAW